MVSKDDNLDKSGEEFASADDLEKMLDDAGADDLDSMLQSEDSGTPVTNLSAASADDLDMMLADEEDALPSIDDIAIEEESPPKTAPKPKIVKQWIAKIFNQELGPFDFEALHEMVHAGELGKTDEVRVTSESQWQPAESIVGLFDGVENTLHKIATETTGNISPQRAVTPLKSQPQKMVAQPQAKEEEGESIWFCQIDGEELGPMSFEKLQGIGKLGKLAADDKVRFEGSGGWIPADSIGGLTLKPAESATPPPAASAPATPPPKATPAPPPPVAAAKPPSPPPAPRPQYTPPAFKPTPKAFVPPKPTKSSSGVSMPSISNPFADMKFDPKVAGIIGVIALLGVAYFVMPMFAGMGDSKYYEETKEIYDKCVAAGDGVASLESELRPRLDAIKAELEEKASASRPMLRTLLDCYRYYFPKVFQGTPEEQEKAMQGLKDRLEQAATYI